MPDRSKRSSLALASFGVATLVLLGLTSCGSDSPSTSDQSAASAQSASTVAGGAGAIAGSSWNLASATIAGKAVGAAGTATLAFDAGGTRVHGSTGCNQFAGTYRQSGSDLTITLGPTTLVACADPAVSAQEKAILAQLPKVRSYTASTQLVLKDASGATLLTYDPGLASLAGTAWHATGVNNGRGAVVGSALVETVTAMFGESGGLSGFSGCNQYNAGFTVSDPDKISITQIVTTRKACDQQAMTLESEYIAALGKAATYEIDGDRLTLRDATGAAQATYVLTS